jgi:acetylornithine/succinyldiaminopimelate/putrescine aminotransferase
LCDGGRLGKALGGGILPIAAIIDCLREHGLSTTAKDRSSFGFSPPIPITDGELAWAFLHLQEALQAVAKRR